MTTRGKHVAALSLDLDNHWTYLRAHGYGHWTDYPSFINVAVPRILRVLHEHGMKITFFVVGRDAEQAAHKDALSAIAEAGHEIGNHSYDHAYGFSGFDENAADREIERCEAAIYEATGQRPLGFRGPAFGLPASALHVLAKRGYRYDASTFPTFVGPLLRRYQKSTSHRDGQTAPGAPQPFGGIRDGTKPNKPYLWNMGDRVLAEVPVTTMPFLRLPFHATYLNYLAQTSRRTANAYFRVALALCRISRTPPSFLLHATDFLGGGDVDDLGFLPGMKQRAEDKLRFMDRILDTYGRAYDVRPVGTFVDVLSDAQRLRQVPLSDCGESAEGGQN